MPFDAEAASRAAEANIHSGRMKVPVSKEEMITATQYLISLISMATKEIEDPMKETATITAIMSVFCTGNTLSERSAVSEDLKMVAQSTLDTMRDFIGRSSSELRANMTANILKEILCARIQVPEKNCAARTDDELPVLE